MAETCRERDERRLVEIVIERDRAGRTITIQDAADKIGRSVRYVHSLVNHSEQINKIVAYGYGGGYCLIERVGDYELEAFYPHPTQDQP
ncbi:MAG: hypothetical protein ACIAXF_13855 [Phycisphaerales bacterium JB063]